MINVQVGKSGYSMSFEVKKRIFGREERVVVECDIYGKYEKDKPLIFVNRGISILNPVDTWVARIGAHKALASALFAFDQEDRKVFHDTLDSWG